LITLNLETWWFELHRKTVSFLRWLKICQIPEST